MYLCEYIFENFSDRYPEEGLLSHIVTMSHQAIKGDTHSITPTSNAHDVYLDQAWAGPEGTRKLCKKWPKCPWSPFLPAFSLSLSLHLLKVFFKFPIVTWQKKRNLRSVLQIVQHDMQELLKKRQPQHCSPFLGYPWRTLVKKNSPRWQNFEQCTWLFTVCGGEMAECLIVYCCTGCEQSCGWMIRAWKEDNWKINDKQSFGKWYMNQPLWTGKLCEDIKASLKFSVKNLSGGGF